MRMLQPSRLSPPASWHPSLNRLLPQVCSPSQLFAERPFRHAVPKFGLI